MKRRRRFSPASTTSATPSPAAAPPRNLPFVTPQGSKETFLSLHYLYTYPSTRIYKRTVNVSFTDQYCERPLWENAAIGRVRPFVSLYQLTFDLEFFHVHTPCSEKVTHFVFEHNFTTTSSILLQFSVTVKK